MPLNRDTIARTAYRAFGLAVLVAIPLGCAPPGDAGGSAHQEVAVQRVSGPGAYLAGRHAQQQRDFAAAAAYYLQALDVNPDNVDLMRRAYALLAAEGNIDGAARVVERLVALKEDTPGGAVVLAARAAQAGRFAEVEKLMAPLPRHGFNSFLVPLGIAWARLGQGRIDDALAALDPLKKAEQLSQLYHFNAGLICDIADRKDKAAEHYQVTVAGPSLSLRVVEIAGSFYVRSGQPAKARALYDRYLAEHPETVLLDGLVRGLDGGPQPPRPVPNARAGLAETLFGAATTVRENNALESSLMFARLALAVQPDFPLAQVLVGDILQSQGRYADANRAYLAIPADAHVYYSAQLRVADNMKRMSDSAAAIQVLQGLAQGRVDRPDALIDLGDVLRSDKRYDEAATAYEQALARVKKVEARHWAVFYSRGIAYERSRQWPRAEKDFLKALELEPEQPYVLNYLGYTWLEQRINVDKAKAMIQRAVAQRPEDGYIVDSLGWSLYLTGDYDGAVREVERAVELQPEDPVINDHLGDAYWRVGRQTEARFQWQRALTLNPEADAIAGLKAKLENGLEPIATGTTTGTITGAGTGVAAQ